MPKPDGAAPPPSLRKRWRRARQRFLFEFSRRLVRRFGFDRSRRIGEGVAVLQSTFARPTFARLRDDLRELLDLPSRREAAALLKESYRVNNGAVFEILSLFDRKVDEDKLAALCEIEGLERLRAALADGRGAVLLGSHAGNAALVVIALARIGFPVSVVYREARMRSPGFFQDGLERYGIQGIVANTGLRAYAQMVAAIRQGRVVFVMIDQGTADARDGTARRFLGKDMPMPGGPAQLARATRAPVLPLEALAARPRWRFRIGEPLALGTGSVDDDLDALFGVVERQIRERPALWSWHHRRWRDFPLARTP